MTFGDMRSKLQSGLLGSQGMYTQSICTIRLGGRNTTATVLAAQKAQQSHEYCKALPHSPLHTTHAFIACGSSAHRMDLQRYIGEEEAEAEIWLRPNSTSYSRNNVITAAMKALY